MLSYAWWVFQLRCDVPWCGESLVRVWREVVVYPLHLRAVWLELWVVVMRPAQARLSWHFMLGALVLCVLYVCVCGGVCVPSGYVCPQGMCVLRLCDEMVVVGGRAFLFGVLVHGAVSV